MNYTIEINKINVEDGGGYLATIPQFGKNVFLGDYETPQKELDNLEKVKKRFEIYLKEGIGIIEPDIEKEKDYSEKMLLRVLNVPDEFMLHYHNLF